MKILLLACVGVIMCGTARANTLMANQYCVQQGAECPGADVQPPKFVTDEHQCQARCNNFGDACQAVFYDRDGTCYSRDTRCATPGFKRYVGSYYRLLETEVSTGCPVGQTLLEDAAAYSSKFCMKPNKRCPREGKTLYPTRQEFTPWTECLTQCTQVKSCGMVNIFPNEAVEYCDPLAGERCDDSELIDDTNSAVYYRLTEDEVAANVGCPDGWITAQDPTNSPLDEGACPCPYDVPPPEPSSEDPLPVSNFANEYCVTPHYECPGTELDSSTAADEHQCTERCNSVAGCEGVYYDFDTKVCSARNSRCASKDEMYDRNVWSLYRLEKTELATGCPNGQTLWASEFDYSTTFCKAEGKSCPWEGLYKKPQKDNTDTKCRNRCKSIRSCGQFNYDTDGSGVKQYCDPIQKRCDESQLVAEAGTNTFIRLLASETACPSGYVAV